MKICGICNEELTNDDKIVACNKCDELYHLDCFEESGGCANPNCDNYVEPSLSLGKLSQVYEDEEYDENNDIDSCVFYDTDSCISSNYKMDEDFEDRKEDYNSYDDLEEGYDISQENEEDYKESYLEDGYGDYYSPEDDEVVSNEYPSRLSKILGLILSGIVALILILTQLAYIAKYY